MTQNDCTENSRKESTMKEFNTTGVCIPSKHYIPSSAMKSNQNPYMYKINS